MLAHSLCKYVMRSYHWMGSLRRKMTTTIGPKVGALDHDAILWRYEFGRKDQLIHGSMPKLLECKSTGFL